MTETLIGLAAMMLLSLARIPIALSMGIVGLVGYASMREWEWFRAFNQLQQLVFDTGRNYTLSVIPLFILMGTFVARAGMAEELFRAAYAFVGHRKGGLAMATVVAAAGFGGPCGSSIATAATMAKVAYPSMKKFGYADYLSSGSIAAGGTLGILIPPSTMMVIYGIITQTNIAALFAAGMLPGVLATILLCVAVRYIVWRDPAAGPPGERTPWPERWKALRGVAAITALFIFSIGGIFAGIFTATEGAGVGAFVAMVFALWRRSLTWRTLYLALAESARTTSMIFFVLIGALMFGEFVNITSMPNDLRDFVGRFAAHPVLVVAAIMAIYVILGTAMEELSMILLTLPVFFPIIAHLGLDPVWFGILIICVVEIGLISPPVGMNLFVLSALIPNLPTRTVFRGVMPFVVIDCVRLAILIAFPIISVWLPTVMKL
ncbi:MAG TPA: TRAP transporter large permease [Burkholderiales bacterium]|nr:TRAP transporter large permease [Burkholderiales bacterium]